MRQFEERFWSGIDLNDLYRECQQQPENSSAEKVFMAGLKEFGKMRQQSPGDPEAMMAGVQRAMRIAITRETEELENHLPMLATIGSTSPYVGLFGTVWGIMGSFQSLSMTQQATLATVAPWIAEALIATAMGLFAAIPAVIFYNRLSNNASRLLGKYEDFAEEFHAILHRNLQGRDGKPSAS